MARAASIYGQTLRTYRAWAGTLLPLAVVVFVPLGLIHAIPVHADLTELDFGGGVELVVIAAALLVLAMTGLIGEVFYAGAVSIALTHPQEGRPPSLREVARMINYRTLIAVDIAFAVLVAVGFVALVVPGIVVFVYLGLAAPAAEIERRGFRDAFTRSFSLVREHFWLVFWVLVPIEVASDVVTAVATSLSDRLLSEWLLSEWLTDTLSNILLTPFYAVAAVLLTIDLIADRDGVAPSLRSTPVPG